MSQYSPTSGSPRMWFFAVVWLAWWSLATAQQNEATTLKPDQNADAGMKPRHFESQAWKPNHLLLSRSKRSGNMEVSSIDSTRDDDKTKHVEGVSSAVDDIDEIHGRGEHATEQVVETDAAVELEQVQQRDLNQQQINPGDGQNESPDEHGDHQPGTAKEDEGRIPMEENESAQDDHDATTPENESNDVEQEDRTQISNGDDPAYEEEDDSATPDHRLQEEQHDNKDYHDDDRLDTGSLDDSDWNVSNAEEDLYEDDGYLDEDVDFENDPDAVPEEAEDEPLVDNDQDISHNAEGPGEAKGPPKHAEPDQDSQLEEELYDGYMEEQEDDPLDNDYPDSIEEEAEDYYDEQDEYEEGDEEAEDYYDEQDEYEEGDPLDNEYSDDVEEVAEDYYDEEDEYEEGDPLDNEYSKDIEEEAEDYYDEYEEGEYEEGDLEEDTHDLPEDQGQFPLEHHDPDDQDPAKVSETLGGTNTSFPSEGRFSPRSTIGMDLSKLVEEGKRIRRYAIGSSLRYQALNAKVDEIMEEVELLGELKRQLQDRVESTDELIRKVNARQLEFYKSQAEETLQKELHRREKLRATISDRAVTMDALEDTFDTDNILKDPTAKLEDLVLSVAREDAVEVYRNTVAPSISDRCVSPVEAAEAVHAALSKYTQDIVGLPDHALTADIVYEHTSSTFTPPPRQGESLGDVWWRRYIPEDWERWFPTGWETWNAAVPDLLYHMLRIPGGTSAPPNAILTPNLTPGACWPMAGHKGNVTIRLDYPVEVTSLTLDHVPSLLVDREYGSSAPKKLQVTGYPPCSDECSGMGFNLEAGFVLGTFQYDINGPSIQTFDVGSVLDSEDDDDEDEESCSETSTSCAADLDFDAVSKQVHETGVVGVKLEVLSNWGNADYTCLYRFRVHGSPIK